MEHERENIKLQRRSDWKFRKKKSGKTWTREYGNE
jgi:hypothetical protein